jgi:uncharacterized protein YecT (DUF1311 family)
MSATASEAYCRSDSCHRALSRTVRYCPFCGTAQVAQVIEEITTPRLNSPLNPIQQHQPVVVQGNPGEVLARQPVDDEAKSNVYEERVDVSHCATHPETKSSSVDPAIEKIQRRPKVGRLVLFAGLFIIAALLLLRTIFHTGATAPVIVQAVARPDQWTAVDVSEFGVGTQLVVAGDGPFRVRTTSDAPILVAGGPIALGQIHRAGFEVKSANGSLVHITIQGAKDSSSRTSENGRGLDSMAVNANDITPASNSSTAAARKSPSFACSRAKVRAEFLICSDQDLAAADYRMAELYRNAILRTSVSATLRIEQRNWLRAIRNACTDLGCLKDVYRERMRQLSSSSG